VSKRPRGRPFQRGQSGNPGGRPKRSAAVGAHKIVADVKAAARELTPQALGTLQEIMEDKKAPAAARVTAATEILSRGWGRPAQRLEAEVGNGTMSFLALVQASFPPRSRLERANACSLRDTRFLTPTRNVIPSANDPEQPFGSRNDLAMAGQSAIDGARTLRVRP
jgi:Family of unknown function (DUF5681)